MMFIKNKNKYKVGVTYLNYDLADVQNLKAFRTNVLYQENNIYRSVIGVTYARILHAAVQGNRLLSYINHGFFHLSHLYT